MGPLGFLKRIISVVEEIIVTWVYPIGKVHFGDSNECFCYHVFNKIRGILLKKCLDYSRTIDILHDITI